MRQSLGIFDPFPWIAKRRAALDLEKLRKDTVGGFLQIKNLKFWETRLDKTLPDRFPLESSERNKAQSLLKSRFQQVVFGGACDFAVVLLLWFTLEFGLDAWSYQSVRTANRKGATTVDQEKAMAWLKKFGTSSFPRHLFTNWIYLSRDGSRGELRSIEASHEEQLWSLVETLGPDPLRQEDSAKNYLARFENGSHSTEANGILDEAKRVKAERENGEQLQRFDQIVKSALLGDDLPSLKAAQDQIDRGLPRPERATDDQRKQIFEAREKISLRQNELSATLDWKGFRQIYDGHIAGGRINQAAAVLGERGLKDDRLQKLKEDFLTKAPELIDRTINSLASNREWNEANKLAEGSSLWPKDLQTPPIKTHFLKVTAKVKGGEDEALYRQALNKRSDESCDAYLKNAPLQSMANEVRAYKSYLDKCRNDLDFKLELTMLRWDANCWNNDYNHVTVFIDGKKAFEKTRVESKRLRSDKPPFPAFSLKRKLDDRIEFDVSIVNKDYELLFWEGDHDHGHVKSSERIRDLKQGLSLRLPFTLGTNEVRFAISGFPTEPALPAWRPKP